jgi:hypothetical protein
MISGLTITVVERDPDYLGVEIQASNGRFAGSAWVFAGVGELGEFAAHLLGFPANANDDRVYEWGSRDPHYAGGYASTRFHCLDHACHAALDITLEDDDQRYEGETARLSFRIEAAAVDRFDIDTGLSHKHLTQDLPNLCLVHMIADQLRVIRARHLPC